MQNPKSLTSCSEHQCVHKPVSYEFLSAVHFSGETTKTFLMKTVSTEAKQVDEEVDIPQTPVPEEEQWDMLSKYENIRQNEFAQREYVLLPLI